METQKVQTQNEQRLTPHVQAIVQRLESANEFIAEIAHRGRRFFEYVHDTDDPAVVRCEVAKFRRDESGKLWLWNEWRCKWIYVSRYGAWRGFHHGGTLHSLVGQLVEWIKGGRRLSASFFTAKHWGYSEDEIGEIIEEGRQRGIVHTLGPWSYGFTTENGEGPECIVLDRDNDAVCEVWNTEDARLIAAAPDLEVALRRLLDCVECLSLDQEFSESMRTALATAHQVLSVVSSLKSQKRQRRGRHCRTISGTLWGHT